MQKTKVCAACGKRRKADKFYKRTRSTRTDQLSGKCKDCENTYNRLRRRRRKKNEDKDADNVTMVDAAPFAKWIKSRVPRYESVNEFCSAASLNSRRVYEISHGRQKKVSVDLVDRALTLEGSAMLWELYPELYP